MCEGRSQETGDRRQEESGMNEKAGEEEELSLGFSASRQPKILTF